MPDTPFTERFDHLVNNTLERWHCPGTAISVVHNGKAWSKSYGLASRNPDRAVDEQTLFYGCSTTKAMLCALWGIHIASAQNQAKPEHQRITFSTPLSKLIPADFVLPDPIRTAQVTLEDVVSHRSGMSRHELSYGHENVRTPKDITRNLRHLPLHNELRTTFEYCNTGYVAASHALEVVVGEPFIDIIRNWLFEPLGMKDTYGGLMEAREKGEKAKGQFVATGYSWTKKPCDVDYQTAGSWREERYMGLEEVTGAGYVISTASDYAKWMQCLLSRSSPLSPEIVKDLWEPRTPATFGGGDAVPLDGDFAMYTLGWFVGSYKGHRIFYHPGGIVGGGSRVMLCSEINWGATFLSNGDCSGTLLKGLLFDLLDSALGMANTGYERCEEAMASTFSESIAEVLSDKVLKTVYPHMPSKPVVPLALPLSSYAGKFTNEGYGTLDIRVGKDPISGESTLVCAIDDRTWTASWTFRRINGEHWRVDADPSRLPESRRAESRVECDGTVSWGVSMEVAMLDILIWFTKAS